ncbi:hypothetical protein A2635_01425 [Candidatus Peribacteria bacterium RIFCSPHIGHO2_01_FULL_51_9]|nr:MAG: hypothetical protein A2635_01425 [Candidatus Peribacteria bacterium RIFCSPHIGHO2_01_FULL_51_9]
MKPPNFFKSPFSYSRNSLTFWSALVVVGVIAAFSLGLFSSARAAAEIGYEKVVLHLSPSAERAFKYGSKHFNGQDPLHYDIDAAEYFFRQALELDPSLTYIHHQIARIYFLHGNFADAFAEISTQIAEHGTSTPNSYYVRGLIEGYMGMYDSAAKDYEVFLEVDPRNWAAINDYAWVLLKAGRAKDAAVATEEGLKYFPENPWLLNSSAIALYEMGQLSKAHERAQKAQLHVLGVEEREWLHSYPGNDPGIAGEGIATFRAAVAENMHRIEVALASSAVE